LVSLVLRGSANVSPAKRAAVEQAVEELNYRPNTAARNLAEQRTMAVGVILNDVRQPWFADLLDGLGAELDGTGYHVLVGDGRLDRRTGESLTRTFLQHGVDGVVLAGSMPVTSAITEIGQMVPTVVAGWREQIPNTDVVANDDLAGGALAAKHLIELGHSRIAYIGDPSALVGELRAEGYASTMRQAGLGSNITMEWSEPTEDGGYRAAVRLLSRADRPTAIFAGNDVPCVGARAAAMELGIDVPGELSLVGYDNAYLARLRAFSLTSVDGAGFEVGRKAAQLLLSRTRDPRQAERLVLVQPSLAVRNTTGPVPAEDR
jgi:DNA-binding LacI/PurR family transcriptional regulator